MVISTNTKEFKDKFDNWFYDTVLSDLDTDKPVNTIQEKAEYVRDRFLNEYGFMLKRKTTVQEVLKEWLQGLALDTPYNYCDILALGRYLQTIEDTLTEKQEDKILSNYWDWLAVKIMQSLARQKVYLV